MSSRDSDNSRRNKPWFKALSPNLRPTDGNGDMSMSASSSFELLERGALLRPAETVEVDASVPYAEGTTIDWHREEAVERERKRMLHAQRGLRGIMGPLMDSAKIWLVIVLTGIGIGVAGAWLDVLVKWSVLRFRTCQLQLTESHIKVGRSTRGSLHVRILLQPGRVLQWS